MPSNSTFFGMRFLEAKPIATMSDFSRQSGLWVEAALPESAFEVCAQLARRHGAPLGLRTLDTLHVASALELKAERFWTFDERQMRLARTVGLKTA